MDIIFWYIFFILVLTIIIFFLRNRNNSLVKNIALAKMNKRYNDEKIYIYEKKIKTVVFSSLIIIPKKLLRPENYLYISRKLGPLQRNIDIQTSIMLIVEGDEIFI